MKKDKTALQLLEETGAVVQGHFVGTSGKHLSVYVAKDRATRFTSVGSKLCKMIAEIFKCDDIDAVVAPAMGGIALSQWTACHLTLLRPDRPEVLALYSEQKDKEFVLGRGFDKDVCGKRVLVVEDVLTTGSSAVSTVRAVIKACGIVVGVGALANGGGVTAEDVGVCRLEALVNIKRQQFSEEECARIGLCAKGVPINTEFGHGAEFLSKKVMPG